MTRIYDFTKTDVENEADAYDNTPEGIKKRVLDGGLYAEFQETSRYMEVKVFDNMGGGSYLSNATDTLGWLTSHTKKPVKRCGAMAVFYVPYTK